MSYLKFDKEHLINLEYALHKEILRSNRAGSYISTTLNGGGRSAGGAEGWIQSG